MSLLSNKLARDLRAARGRVLTLILTLALSSAAVLSLVHARDRLLAAMADNTARTHPAHAQLMGAAPDPAMLHTLRALPGVVDAQVGAVARAQAGGRRVMLFALPEAGEPRLAHPLLQSGRWPAQGEVLIERDGAAWVGEALGLDGGPRLPVSGLAHDPMLAPSSTEGLIYGYVRAATLVALPHADFTLLRFEQPRDQADVDARTRAVVAWLAERGVAVDQARVPALGEHPHQRQAAGAMQMLLACGLLCLAVCSLAATVLVRGLLERQRPDIGVLRAMGADTPALLGAYLRALARLSAVCLSLATLLGLAGGELLARVSARLLNLDLVWQMPSPLWVDAWLLCAILPLLAALPPLAQTLRRPVRVLLGRPELSRPTWLDRLPLRRWPLQARLALRHLLRRRQRHALSVALLAVAGAVFMGGLALREAWLGLVDQGEAAKRYQLELRLSEPVDRAVWLALPQVEAAEPWDTQTATWAETDETPLARSHADGAHDQLLLRRVPPHSTLLAPEHLQGHWPPRAGEIALNRGAAQLLGRLPKLGETIRLATASGPVEGRLGALFDEALAPASVYLPAASAETGKQWRLRLRPGTAPGAWLRALPPELAARVTGSTTAGEQRRAALGHVLVLVRSLALVAGATALVGLMTLASSLGLAVAERRAEFATLRALGAPAGLLARTVMLEGLVVALLAVAVATALRPLLDAWLVGQLGTLSGQPLRAGNGALPLLAWLGLSSLGALAACALPAWTASRSSLKPALEGA